MIISMNKSLSTVLLTITAIISFGLGWFLKPIQYKSQASVVEKEIVQKVIVDRPREAIEGHIRKRELAAKEYYEKAFNLFLLSLGLKLSTQQNESLESLLKDPKSYLEKAPKKPEFQKTSMKETYKDLFLPYRKNSYEKEDYRFLPEDLKDKLKRDNLAEPLVTYSKSKYIEDFKKLKRYLGEYRGELFLIEGKSKGQVHQVYMGLDFTSKEGEGIDGSFNLQLFNGEKVYSDNRGTGGNRDVRKVDDHLIIDVGPGWFFMFPKGKVDTGHYYQDGKLSGIVRLEKQ